MDKAKHGGKPPRSNSAHQEKLSGKKRPRSDAGGESKSHHGGGGGKPKHGDGNKDWKMKPGKKITKEDLEQIKQKKAQSHPHHDIISTTVRYWNELRERKTPMERKKQLVAEIMRTMRGKILEVAMRHDTSRVVQGCIKYGVQGHRDEICKAMYGRLLELSKSKHGHQLVQKMLLYGSNDVRMQVAKEFKGHIVRLMTHNLGAVVVESGFTRAWPPKLVWELYQELYGAEYIHFKAELAGGAVGAPGASAAAAAAMPQAKNLGAVLAARPDKKKSILDSIFFTLSRQTDKGLLSLTVAQRLLCEYLTYAPPEHICAMVTAIREQILSLVASREGAKAACLALHYGTAKDRKVMLRCLKGHMLDMACHLHGHMVLVTALEVTDDTKTSGAAIFAELGPHFAYLACHKYGKRVLLSLLAPHAPQYFAAYDVALLAPVTLPAYLTKRKSSDEEKDAGKPKPKPGTMEEPDEPAAAPGTGGAGEGGAAASASHIMHKLPQGPTPEQAADAEAMAPTRTSRKPDEQRRAELLAQMQRGLESVCISHTSVLARSQHGAVVLLEVASKWATPAVLTAIADLVVSEPSAEEIGAAVDEMNAAAASASAAAQARASGIVEEVQGPALGGAGAGAGAGAREEKGSGKGKAHGGAGAASSASGGADGEAPRAAKRMKFADADADADGDGDAAMGGNDIGDDEGGEEGVERPATDGWAASGEGGAGGAGEDSGMAGVTEMLLILEDTISHMLFKRLLQREVDPAKRGAAGPGRAEKAKKAADSDGAGAKASPPSHSTPAAPVFGPLLAERLRGKLVEVACSSSRAALVITELLASAASAVASSVATELRAGLAKLRKAAGNSSAGPTKGVEVLVAALEGSSGSGSGSGGASSTPASGKAGKGGKEAATPSAASSSAAAAASSGKGSSSKPSSTTPAPAAAAAAAQATPSGSSKKAGGDKASGSKKAR